MELRIGGSAADRCAMVSLGRREVALLRAAASLAEHSDRRKNAAHLADPLRELAERIEARIPEEVREAA